MLIWGTISGVDVAGKIVSKKKDEMTGLSEKHLSFLMMNRWVKVKQERKEMKDYLSMLKALPGEEAVKKSRENLIKSNILQENGEFTEQYRYSKIYTEKQR